MVGKTKYQTKADERRLSTLVEIGCIPCLIEGRIGAATIQHVTDCGRRHEDQHRMTYGSCPWHHMAVPPGRKEANMAKNVKAYGPSFAYNRGEFAERYGTELQLVQIADALVRMVERARQDGWFYGSAKLKRLAIELHGEIVLGRRPSDEWNQKSATA